MDEVMESTSSSPVPEGLAEPAAAGGTANTAAGNASITLLRANQETESVFPVHERSIIGRFDPSVGPIDVDLGGLEEGSYVSRKHATIEKTDSGWQISDLGSSNGTWISENGNFNRVETAPLTDGTVFALGNAQFIFHCDGAPASTEESTVATESEADCEPPPIADLNS